MRAQTFAKELVGLRLGITIPDTLLATADEVIQWRMAEGHLPIQSAGHVRFDQQRTWAEL